MANEVINWTERTIRDPNDNAKWIGSETTSIYNEQNKGKGSILTRNIPANKLSEFEFKFNVDISDAGQGGAIVFYANDDGTQYYAITWKMEWSKTTFYLGQDNSTTGSVSTAIHYWEISTLNNSQGAQTISCVVKVDNGLLSFDCIGITNPEQYANWQYLISNLANNYNEGYVGYGAYDGWDSSHFTWHFNELNELQPSPSKTRPRFWLIN